MKIKTVHLLFTVIFLHSFLFFPLNADEKKWSVKTADSTIIYWDSIIKSNQKWFYDNALLARSIYEVYKNSGNKKYYEFFKNYVDYFITDDNSIKDYSPYQYSLDNIQPARNLLILYNETKNTKYKKPILQFVEQMNNQPRGKSGGFWHKGIYPNQMWLDGLYMAEPFLTGYAKNFSEPVWFDEAVKQFTLIYEKTLDKKTGLLYHVWDESKHEQWADPETGLSQFFWSRAIGWYLMGIVDILDDLPQNHPGRPELIKILQNVSAALEKVQDQKTGLWHQILDMAGKKGNYQEASGTCMFIYVFSKGVKKGYLNEKFKTLAEKAFDGVIKNLIKENSDGYIILNNICSGLGLGGKPYRDGSYEYYTSVKIIPNDPKGLAPFILACIELDK